MKRLGTVLVFKEGIPITAATAALELIKDMLELPKETHDYVPDGPKRCKTVVRPFKMTDKIHVFDDDCGSGPVWYIP